MTEIHNATTAEKEDVRHKMSSNKIEDLEKHPEEYLLDVAPRLLDGDYAVKPVTTSCTKCMDALGS